MKNEFIKVYITFLVLLAGLFFSMTGVQAASFQSEQMPISTASPVSLDGEDFTIKNLTFYKWEQNENNAGNLHGQISLTSDTSYVSTYFTVYYYDTSDNLVAVSKKNVTFYKNYQYQQFIDILLSKDDFINDFTIEDIAKYKITYSTTKPSTTIETKPNTETSNSSSNIDLSSLSYYLSKYDIDMTVNENNVLDITETITAQFNSPKHGIIRSIPIQNTVTRLDGTSSKNRAHLSDLFVNDEYKLKKADGNYQIKIGSASNTITGSKTYKIKYKYNLGKDPLKDKDELYFNLIGNEWDTAIGNITFTVKMPKEFDSSKLGFSSGYVGATDSSNIKYEVEGNTIKGSYNGTLGSRQGITIRCELEEGYFEGAKNYINPIVYISIIVSIIFMLVALTIWYKYGKDDLVVETVEFYPPQNMNSLEAGFTYKGKADNKDVTSLLIYLANKGYLKISDKKIDLTGEKVNLGEEANSKAEKKILELENLLEKEKSTNPNSSKIKYYENMLNIYRDIDKPIDYKLLGLASAIDKLNKKSTFTIEKLKDYDGVNAYEEIFMEGLFEFGRTETNETLLYNNFYTTNNQIKGMLNSKKNRDLLFEKSSRTKKKYLVIMLICIYCLITIPAAIENNQIETLPFALLFPGIGLTVLISLVINGIKTFNENKIGSLFEIFFVIFWGGGFGGIPWAFLVLPALLTDQVYIVSLIIGLIAIIVIVICLCNLQKRTKYGTEMLGKLRGFKNFLETAEKEKLEALVQENPTYFYDILPFTYVLGVSDKWIKKFETISLKEPDWYESESSFNMISLNTFMTHTMKSAESSMTSSPASSSGGGSSSGGSSSGGGSSGGGSGGGGGSSW